MGQRDYRDDVIEILAASELDLQASVRTLAERAVRAEHERDSYRLICTTWAHAARQQHLAHEELNERYCRLQAEYREHRERAMRDRGGVPESAAA